MRCSTYHDQSTMTRFERRPSGPGCGCQSNCLPVRAKMHEVPYNLHADRPCMAPPSTPPCMLDHLVSMKCSCQGIKRCFPGMPGCSRNCIRDKVTLSPQQADATSTYLRTVLPAVAHNSAATLATVFSLCQRRHVVVAVVLTPAEPPSAAASRAAGAGATLCLVIGVSRVFIVLIWQQRLPHAPGVRIRKRPHTRSHISCREALSCLWRQTSRELHAASAQVLCSAPVPPSQPKRR